MGAPSWAIPVGSLSAICGVAFIFVWWWFPRMWKKGTQQEIELATRERAERERYMQQRNLEAGITPEGKEAHGASTQEKEASVILTEEKVAHPAPQEEKQGTVAPAPE